ncbi:hypothetical protein Gpo141_00008273, partial [Globisporangium polare]
MLLTTGALVRIIGSDDVGVLMQIRDSSQTCVVKLTSGVLRKNVPLDDVVEAKARDDARNSGKSPIRLVAGEGAGSPGGARSDHLSPEAQHSRLDSLATASRPSPIKTGSSKLYVGDTIKARYNKGAKWFGGKITRVRSDGTYDVEYEDGDVEMKVEMAFIEAVATSAADDDRNDSGRPASPKSKKSRGFTVGEKVKARFKKGSKWFGGKITRVRSDGTYDVEYEDGDV